MARPTLSPRDVRAHAAHPTIGHRGCPCGGFHPGQSIRCAQRRIELLGPRVQMTEHVQPESLLQSLMYRGEWSRRRRARAHIQRCSCRAQSVDVAASHWQKGEDGEECAVSARLERIEATGMVEVFESLAMPPTGRGQLRHYNVAVRNRIRWAR